MRLIDADALIDFLDCGHLRNPSESCLSEHNIINILKARPTVDAVEVVRCGQCDLSKTCAYRLRSGFKSNDFCSYGERKDGAEGQREMTNSEALECFESDCETCQFKGDDCKSCRTKVAISALRAQDKELRRFFLARETHGIY